MKSRVPYAVFAALLLATLACRPGDPDDRRVIHRHREARFELEIEYLGAAAPERLRAVVRPRGDYHLSLEYPSRLELGGETVRVRDDAEEASETRLAFLAEVPGEAGPGRLEGRLRFGVCLGEDLCEAVSHDFKAELN